MKKLTFLGLFVLVALAGNSTTWIVTNVGESFSPATLMVVQGDTVIFNIENLHNVVEVSEATWNANDNMPLPGGFQLPFGGGMLLTATLTPGTHFYVCQPHAHAGMKGQIIVEGVSQLQAAPFPTGMLILPNPTQGAFQLMLDAGTFSQMFDLEIYTLHGVRIYERTRLDPRVVHEIDLSGVPHGSYVVRVFDDAQMFFGRVVVQ